MVERYCKVTIGYNPRSTLFGCRAEDYDVCKNCHTVREMREWIQAQPENTG